MVTRTHSEESMIRLSSESIIELIRDHRNELIAKLLNSPSLQPLLENHISFHPVSPIKEKFIRQTLDELSKSSLDLTHYSKLILEIRKMDSHVLNNSNERFFIKEIENAISNYLA